MTFVLTVGIYLYVFGSAIIYLNEHYTCAFFPENPWECDCELGWLPGVATLNSSWIYDVRCAGPQNLAEKLVNSVKL